MKAHLAPNPVTIRLFGADGIALDPQDSPDLVHELELGVWYDELRPLPWPAAARSSPWFALTAVLHGPNVAPWSRSRQVIPRFSTNTHLGRNISV
jgi:hypothetical protein